MSPKKNGSIYAALSGLLFGLIGYFGVSLINEHISIYSMLFWRFFVASLVLFALLVPKLKEVNISLKDLSKLVFYGAAFYGSCSILYFVAAQYIGSGLAMVIFFTYPAFVMLFNFILYRFKVSKIYYLAIIIIFMGMICLANGEEIKFDLLGLGVSLLSALCYASYLVVSKTNPAPPLISTLLISLGSALICLALALIDNSFVIPSSLTSWINILGIAVICTAIPIILLLKGLTNLSSLEASILSVLEPVFVVIFGVLLLGEHINLIQILGISVILSGALLTLLSYRFD